MNEKQFIYYFERFSKSINPFDIQLNGFGQFPPNTIYVNVLTKEPIINIVKNMKIKFSGFLRPTKHQKPFFILNPHLTIARRMLESQYYRAWEEWKDTEYISTFRANEMILLKRKITGGKCETIARFPFEGNGMSDVQLMLQL
jgi:2'-5' RNA ligase